MARLDSSQYGAPQKIKDPKAVIEVLDGTILKVGHKYVLLSAGGTPVEWEETYGIREQMIAIWGYEKAMKQLSDNSEG
jgi:hypothetical protein